MKTEEIYRLLDAFYNGETTVEEEQRLLDYFSSKEISGELLEEKEVFLRMYQAEDIEVPVGLESKLENLIDNLAKEEGPKVETKPQPARKRLVLWIGSAAATIAILVSVTFYLNNKPEISNPPIAQGQNLSEADMQTLKEAQDALILLSSNFNKGMEQLGVVSSNLDKTNEILNKTLNRTNDKES
ncbi:hypothetical protein [Prevotella sp. 10(H)]|uniref:hypothetical protein n=1 Tax=Prevotella sp. 10(H) TaxID=1158294 RepID=UPI0004A74D91|nr:hypothetical protein [Prevotella sp. 10(H)]